MNKLLDCGHPESEHSEITTGYGILNGKTFCYECCAVMDKLAMHEDGKYTLYLVKRDNGYHVVNWPSSLDIKVKSYKRGNHNLAGSRIDVWFNFEGEKWHGVQYGEFTQICHCKRIK